MRWPLKCSSKIKYFMQGHFKLCVCVWNKYLVSKKRYNILYSFYCGLKYFGDNEIESAIYKSCS